MTTIQGLKLEEHTLTVPLTKDDDGRTIDVFARVVTGEGGEKLPYLVYLQGGPGYEAPRVSAAPASPSWLPAALKRFRVVMLDQRGTGRSTPVSEETLEMGSAAEVAEYMSHLRADGIVRDAEAFREHLGASGKEWNILGQSFGGFTLLHYLSFYPGSVRRAYFTGGIPPVGGTVDEFYSMTFDKMRWLSENYYRAFPEDREKMREALKAADAGEIVLPSGEVVSVSRLRSLGMLLGGNDGWVSLHALLEWDPRSIQFRYDLQALLDFSGRNPIYYVLHESCGADGGTTNWSAERVMPDDFREDLTLLTGEHVDSAWADTVPDLKPWKDVAHELAKIDWPRLFDEDGLRSSDAQGAAAIYYRDAYVPFEFSMDTIELIPGVRQVITNSQEHNGLRALAGDLLDHMFDVSEGLRYR